MTKIRLVKTNFTAGEITPDLLGRGDLRAYENGCLSLQNITIQPTGGLSRRMGTYFIDTAPGRGRLISFEFNADQAYVLLVTNGSLRIYGQGLLVATIPSPWTEAQIKNLTWTQSADTVLLTHPDVPPKKLQRLADLSWALTDWVFAKMDAADVFLQPYYKFAGETVTLTPSATTGSITVTASASVFVAGHAGTRLRIANKELTITSVNSGTVISAMVNQTLSATTATIDWAEQAFSSVRGYPVAAAFHQDRLVIGGSRDLPNRLWLSQSGDLWNFNKGTGLDDEAIEFGLFSDQINAIRAVFSGRHLQVFTSGAEWIVTGTPLTPANIQLNRQTRIGSIMNRYVPPVDVDGATLFVGRTGRDMREFLYADVEQAYQAADLALFAQHLLKDPVDQCFSPLDRILYLPLADGTLAVLTIYRTEEVFGWARMQTDGLVLSVATVGNTVYALVERNGSILLERFDSSVLLDSALVGESVNPVSTWSGLNHLNGQNVTAIADDVVFNNIPVVGNSITLPVTARRVVVGLPYTHVIEPLPPGVLNLDGGGRATRLVRVVFRVRGTRALTVDVGRGLRDIPLRRFGQNNFDQTPPPYSGDVTVHAFGWSANSTKSLWRIEQTLPLPCVILGATMELKVND
jgi:hypothetical protein